MRPVFSTAAAVALALAVAPAATAQSRVSQLHDALHLSAEQERGWRDFAAATQPGPEAQAQAQAGARLAATLPTPRRLALIRAQMQADLSRFDRTAQTVTAFYESLNPEQQRTFDRETASAQGSAGGR